MKFGSRRRFLLASAGFGAAVGLGGSGWFVSQLASSSRFARGALVRTTRTSCALGSNVSITALHSSTDTAEKAIAAAFDELETVEQVMSIYRPESELSRLNRTGSVNAPHPYLLEVLRQAEAVSRESDGAFDVTVQPLWQLYSAAHQEGRLPDESAVAAVRSKVDWRQVEISPHRVSLRGAGTAVTLNGIGQGFATDRALATLRQHGIEHALINAGELAPLGADLGGEAWLAGIQHPRAPEAYVGLARLEGRCLATTGDYETAFTPDRKYNHVFDPRTGSSPDELASVSIVAPTGIQADALSTAVFVLGPEKGLALVESLDGVDAFFVLKNGRTLATAGFPMA
jgi:thiamine biosynthesis lipoprotein